MGNGQLGAMIYGKHDVERISINHDTLWSGKPGDNFVKGAFESNERAKELLKEGNWNCLVVAGGVAANSHLRRRLERLCANLRVPLFLPPLSLCGDNAAMIGAQAFHEADAGNFAGLDLNASAADEF